MTSSPLSSWTMPHTKATGFCASKIHHGEGGWCFTRSFGSELRADSLNVDELNSLPSKGRFPGASLGYTVIIISPVFDTSAARSPERFVIVGSCIRREWGRHEVQMSVDAGGGKQARVRAQTAPLSRRSVAIRNFPLRAAKCSGVSPQASLKFTSTPSSMARRTSFGRELSSPSNNRRLAQAWLTAVGVRGGAVLARVMIGTRGFGPSKISKLDVRS
mmetsp:Transcript_12056/g.28481  ORF Transcript_12056/g.28481 Transcript_12056/m.28481 type:complete len:217 (+) Transcript_12056:101-751(+)